MNKEMKETEVCKECRFVNLCIELGYPLNCENVNTCEHYDAYLDGYIQGEEYEGY